MYRPAPSLPSIPSSSGSDTIIIIWHIPEEEVRRGFVLLLPSTTLAGWPTAASAACGCGSIGVTIRRVSIVKCTGKLSLLLWITIFWVLRLNSNKIIINHYVSIVLERHYYALALHANLGRRRVLVGRYFWQLVDFSISFAFFYLSKESPLSRLEEEEKEGEDFRSRTIKNRVPIEFLYPSFDILLWIGLVLLPFSIQSLDPIPGTRPTERWGDIRYSSFIRKGTTRSKDIELNWRKTEQKKRNGRTVVKLRRSTEQYRLIILFRGSGTWCVCQCRGGGDEI